MTYCMDNVVPVTTVRCFLYNKPWITSNVKAFLNQKKRVFRDGDREDLKSTNSSNAERERRRKTTGGRFDCPTPAATSAPPSHPQPSASINTRATLLVLPWCIPPPHPRQSPRPGQDVSQNAEGLCC
ncbi:hypothetical protein LDENG_00190210 [Lucifuga dentata]|nr:hypothetical protein LDENG_00190210 [Lucifuga dentata]